MITRKLSRVVASEELETRFASEFIQCMASGEQDDLMKFYFFAKENKGKAFLIEASVHLRTFEISLVVKIEESEFSKDFMKLVYKILQPLIQAS